MCCRLGAFLVVFNMRWFYCLQCRKCKCNCPEDDSHRHLDDLRSWFGDIAVHSLHQQGAKLIWFTSALGICLEVVAGEEEHHCCCCLPWSKRWRELLLLLLMMIIIPLLLQVRKSTALQSFWSGLTRIKSTIPRHTGRFRCYSKGALFELR